MRIKRAYETYEARRTRANAIMRTLATGDEVVVSGNNLDWARTTVTRFTATLVVLDGTGDMEGATFYRDGNNIGLRRGQGRWSSMFAGNDPFAMWMAAESEARQAELDIVRAARRVSREFATGKRPWLGTSYYPRNEPPGALADVELYLSELRGHGEALTKILDEGMAKQGDASMVALTRLAELEAIALPHGNPRWSVWEVRS
jgi:hypothetical protein